MIRKRLTNGRVFPFEDEETVVIDVFDDELAAYDGNAGQVVNKPIILNLRTGEVRLEE